MFSDPLSSHIYNALVAAFGRYTELGKDGIRPIQKNQYGDTAMYGDIACEETIIAYFQDHQLPIRIHSEEHGIVDITDNPKYLAVLDGIDGSICYQNYFTGDEDARFGTLLTLFSSLDPKYQDYICAGSMEHSTGNLYFCEQGLGAKTYHIPSGTGTSLRTAPTGTFSLENRIFVDDNPTAEHNNFIKETFVIPLQGYSLSCLFSAARYYADLASGEVDLVLECTRKGNLELAFGYALTRESGGVILDQQGTELGMRSFLQFGQDRHLATIGAASYSLAKECINYLTEVQHYRSSSRD